MRWCFACIICLSLTLPNRAVADVDSYYVSSLESIVDASQSVWLATAVRENEKTRIKSVDRVIKGAGDKSDLAVADLSSNLRAAGEHRVLLFLRPDAKKAALEVHYVIYLNKQPLPKMLADRSAAYRAAIPEGYGRPQPNDCSWCAAIDRTGRVLVEPDEVVKLVGNRARLHPTRFTDAGFYAPRGDELEDQNSDYNVFVPYDPEERDAFLKQLGSASGLERVGAAGHLAHYPGADVIAALKKCLTDDYHNNQLVGEGSGNEPRTANIYIVRRAAYESLRHLKVNVPKSELEHRQ